MESEDRPAEERKHPLVDAGFPEWLTRVPLDVRRSAAVALGGDKSIAASLLMSALDTEVGARVLSFSIVPELQHLLAQASENASWLNIPTEPTSVERTSENEWQVRVGDYTEVLSSAGIWAKLADALDVTDEGGE